jgi:hypothetical protein
MYLVVLVEQGVGEKSSNSKPNMVATATIAGAFFGLWVQLYSNGVRKLRPSFRIIFPILNLSLSLSLSSSNALGELKGYNKFGFKDMHEEFMNSLYFLLCLCACFLSWCFFFVVVEHGCLYACMHALSLSCPFGFLYMLSFLVVLLLNMVACRSLFELSFFVFVHSFLSWCSCIVEHGCTNDMFLLCVILLF